jgi:hypothetical protein
VVAFYIKIAAFKNVLNYISQRAVFKRRIGTSFALAPSQHLALLSLHPLESLHQAFFKRLPPETTET